MLRIAVLGAKGNIARPVVRRLVDAGFGVRALTRDPEKARSVLPPGVEAVAADLFDADSLARAFEGCGAVYINLANPMSPRPRDPDLSGTTNAIAAAGRAGVERVLRISALGVSESDPWWVVRRKAQADAALMASGLRCTIFRPAWFMESLPMFIVGGRGIVSMQTPMATHWIAGDDYAREVVSALRRADLPSRVYDIQGPDPIPLPEAVRRLARAWSPRLIPLPMPAMVRRAMRPVVAPLRYLDDLIDFYRRAERACTSQPAWTDLGKPSMTIEDYAAYTRRTGDVPRK